MNKNVYSLVLMDEVVAAVDRMAYEQNTSRSSLINQILAEYLSCPIPETRIRDIFSAMEEAFSGLGNFQVRLQPSDTMLSIRSALHYPYNPSIRYVLELFRDYETEFGELRVSLRTQNQPLVRTLTDFFLLWERLENRWGTPPIPDHIEPGRYARRLRVPKNPPDSSEETALAISGYIRNFDTALKEYFSAADEPEVARAQVENIYRDYAAHAAILL